MHLPDPFLDAKTAMLAAAIASTGVGIALKAVRETIEPRQMPLLGLAGAFVFAAQMLNFPIPGGTSGHLIGGVLTAILLGPGAATLVITCVLIIQCVMFADGGLLALGANIFNMGIVSVLGGYGSFRFIRRFVPLNDARGTVFAAAFAGWFGTVLSAISCAGQLALAKTAPWNVTFAAMTNVHMFIGIGEGLATALVVMAVLRKRPELVQGAYDVRNSFTPGTGMGYVLLLIIGFAFFVAPFACPWPDGLEKVGQLLGFSGKNSSALFPSPMPGYRVAFLRSAALATSIAGAVGTVVAFISAYLLARVLVPTLDTTKKNVPGK
jgi:cobalt/nickel transport system permease protein